MGKAAVNRAGAAVADSPGLCGWESNQFVADELGVSQGTVSKWRSRFLRARLEGLTDEPRPGRPRTVGDDKIEPVVTRALEQPPPGGDTHWSTRSVAGSAGVPSPRCPELAPGHHNPGTGWLTGGPFGSSKVYLPNGRVSRTAPPACRPGGTASAAFGNPIDAACRGSDLMDHHRPRAGRRVSVLPCPRPGTSRSTADQCPHRSRHCWRPVRRVLDGGTHLYASARLVADIEEQAAASWSCGCHHAGPICRRQRPPDSSLRSG